ncbi:MAG: hypothetical protein RLY86_1303 [Pseudomonadota bacterium]
MRPAAAKGCRKGLGIQGCAKGVRVLEELSIIVRGLILGVAIAAPVGPIGLLCIRRTIERGLHVGLATGLGAATADVMFAAIAAFGVGAIVETITGHESQLRLLGGVFLIGVAIHSFLRDPQPLASQPEARNLWGAGASGFALTMGNPVTILGITAIVIGFGGDVEGHHAWTLLAGIFLGSLAWWCILCGGVTLIRHHITQRTVHWINVGTGIFLIALAVWALGSVWLEWVAG